MITEYFSWSRLPLGVVAALLLWWVYASIVAERKIRRLGGHAPVRGTRAPFAVDLIYEGIKHSTKDDNLKFWHKNFTIWGNRHNPYTVEASPAGERIIFTADPENIKALLASQFNDFGKGEAFNRDWHEFLGDSIFSTDGQVWHDSRQLIRPQFIKDRVSDLECFERHSQDLMSLMGGKGQVVDVKDLFFRFTLDAATEFILGRSVGSLHTTNSEFADAFAEVQRLQNLIARAGPLQRLVPRKAFRRHLRTLNEFVEPFVTEALALSPSELEQRSKSDQGYTFLHAIAAYTRDRTVLRDQLVAVLLAGRDTTACTLCWLFSELSRQPQLVSDLRSEIFSTVGTTAQPTYANLKSMKLLQHTISETLRLYPIVPFNMRFALRDTSLPHGGGPDGNSPIGIPKHTPCVYSTHYMQLTPEIYPETSENFPPPEVFAPRRWEKWQPRVWTYVPFNGGPRICVGQNFAITEMGYAICRILQRFSKIEGRSNGEGAVRDTVGGVLDEKRGHPLGSVGSAVGAMTTEDRNEMGWAKQMLGSPSHIPWSRRRGPDAEPDLVEKVVESRPVMRSEIVLQPAQSMWMAFYE